MQMLKGLLGALPKLAISSRPTLTLADGVSTGYPDARSVQAGYRCEEMVNTSNSPRFFYPSRVPDAPNGNLRNRPVAEAFARRADAHLSNYPLA